MSASNICVYCRASDDSRSLYATCDIFGDQYTLHQCNNCQSYFLSPNPTEEQLLRAYDESYYSEKEEKFEGLTERALDIFRKERARLVSSYLPRDGTILDIGCGNGRFLKYILLHGNFDVYGIETPGNSAKRAARIPEIKLKVGVLQEDDYPDEFFDAVTLFHVFEHLPNPADTLRVIVKILKRGGVCVMSFPNIDSFQSRLFKGKWLHLDPPRHLSYFAPGDFINIVRGYGLIAEKVSYMSVEQNPFGMVQSILNCLGGKREILFESLKGNSGYVRGVPKATLIFQRIFFLTTFPLFIFSDMIESVFKKGATVQFILRKK